MKSLVICFSYHHKNTAKVAAVMANVLGAELLAPADFKPESVSEYSLIGFGSGIYFGKISKVLLDLADKLPQAKSQKVFIFSTSGQENNASNFHRLLREKLVAKGYAVAGEFNCAGFDTFGLLKIAGGIKKGRPNEADLKEAEAFAQSLKGAT